MKHIILPSTVLEFTWLVIDGYMDENGITPLSQKGHQDPPTQKVPKKFEIFPAPSCRIQKKFSPPQKKYICGYREYIPWKIMIQIQTTTYLLGQGTKSEKLQKLRLGSFFWLRFVFTIFYTESFQVPPKKKSPPLKVPIPTQSPNLTYVPPT